MRHALRGRLAPRFVRRAGGGGAAPRASPQQVQDDVLAEERAAAERRLARGGRVVPPRALLDQQPTRTIMDPTLRGLARRATTRSAESVADMQRNMELAKKADEEAEEEASRPLTDRMIEALPERLQGHARLWKLGCDQTILLYWPFAWAFFVTHPPGALPWEQPAILSGIGLAFVYRASLETARALRAQADAQAEVPGPSQFPPREELLGAVGAFPAGAAAAAAGPLAAAAAAAPTAAQGPARIVAEAHPALVGLLMGASIHLGAATGLDPVTVGSAAVGALAYQALIAELRCQADGVRSASPVALAGCGTTLVGSLCVLGYELGAWKAYFICNMPLAAFHIITQLINLHRFDPVSAERMLSSNNVLGFWVTFSLGIGAWYAHVGQSGSVAVV